MQKIRNIAIIAHVDHGKTTLVDKMLHQVKLFRENQEMGDLILDNNDLERERGITILSKNVSVRYKGVKINIIDTPGHSDFGGEVERVLNMADGVVLLVDALEGPMPQTRFVLQKALSLEKKVVCVVNKVDKPNCRPDETHEAVFDLMFNLDATEEQLEFKTVYGSSKEGWMSEDHKKPTEDLTYLLDTIIEEIPAPEVKEGEPQMMITSLDYSSYVGRIAIGRINRGEFKTNMPVSVIHRDGSITKSVIKELHRFEGLGKEKTVEPISSGEIVALVGLEKFDIGDTVSTRENPDALTPISVDEPTMSMLFTINDSPFFGQEGKFLTSRHLRDRLMAEIEKNLALRVKETGSADRFLVYGRGILHLSILVETMRREGYEFQLGQPQVLYKEIDGQKCEPVELLTVHVPEAFAGKVIELVTNRKGDILNIENKSDVQHLEFSIPARGLIGLRNLMLTATEGEAVIAHRFKGYEPFKGNLGLNKAGALICMENGIAIPYSIDKLQDRGKFFVNSTEPVYEGQVVGEHGRNVDLIVNITKTKKLTNMRASGTDDKMGIVPPIKMSLEEYMEYVRENEYIEVTPSALRLRKILRNENERKRADKK